MEIHEFIKKIDKGKLERFLKEQKKKWVPVCVILIGMIVLGIGLLLKPAGAPKEDPQVFTEGDLKVALKESSWGPKDALEDKEEVDFSPTVVNEGGQDAYLFVQLDMPSAYVVTITPEGEQVSETAFFRWKVLDGWVQIGEIQKNENHTIHTYTYAYGTDQELTALKTREEAKLFDKMTFANIIGGVDPKEEELQTSVRVYAISKEELENLKGSEEIEVSEIWEGVKETKQ